MKKIIGLLMALAMLFTLAACGNSNGGASTNNQNSSTTNLKINIGYYANFFDEGIISVTITIPTIWVVFLPIRK